MSAVTTGRRRASYLRLSLTAASRGLIKAFNTTKTSWVGLVVFLLVALLAVLAGFVVLVYIVSLIRMGGS